MQPTSPELAHEHMDNYSLQSKRERVQVENYFSTSSLSFMGSIFYNGFFLTVITKDFIYKYLSPICSY